MTLGGGHIIHGFTTDAGFLAPCPSLYAFGSSFSALVDVTTHVFLSSRVPAFQVPYPAGF